MEPKRLEVFSFLGLLVLILLLMFFVFLPYLTAVILAYVFTILFWPFYERVQRMLGGRSGIAAIATVILVLIAVLAPLTLFGFQIFEEAYELYNSATSATLGSFGRVLSDFLESTLQTPFPDFSLNFTEYTRDILSWLIQNFGSVFSRITTLFAMFFLSLFALYYFLKDGEKFTKALVRLSPLSDSHTKEIFDKIYIAASSIIKGSLVVGILQGILAGIGFWIFGVPNPALWGSLTIIASLIPILGTALVMFPAVLYLFLVGSIPGGIGLLIWGVFVVGLLDNFVRPQIIRRGVHIHPLFILLSVLGGIRLLGPVGFVVGPLALSFLFALLSIYPEIVQEHK